MKESNSENILVIGICADVHTQGVHQYHQAGDKYVRALTSLSQHVVPVIIPALFHELSEQAQDTLLATLDGVMLTGSYSNLHPGYYQSALPDDDDAARDPHRDASNWKLIEKILAADLPLLGICRGFQELNVYFGGTLHHRIHEVPGLMDHREDKSLPLEQQYACAHSISLTEKGVLSQWFAPRQEIKVNSIHMQGIDRLGKHLKVEATAPDGLVEAFSCPDYTFLVAVQWHPEWQPHNYPDNASVIQGFIQACTTYKNRSSQ
ncbi:gamma-glutamyl-gamma-aminobutyrate hydrolase family protein [Lacimicrobium sp. SS2-24]|uniref:gamma-glutamyl-gamma-aminobutyrate hydrolase family protein n=1 Tax=Lacimicrobium sp. SS2-24 TaxID=2005569 RepID=UPI000B4B4D43|nr:gamma-glutamyl-gamma-aminobutyrate hydrolase family protein [Lacimicrobium sp. SS2-24]